MEPSDSPAFRSLLTTARAGNSPAFEALVRPLLRLGFSLGFAVLGQAEDAEDAVQEALIRLARKLPDAATERDFRAYFCRLVLNESRRIRAKRWIGISSRTAVAVDPGLEEKAHFGGLARKILELLPKLTSRERQIFVLRAFEELETAEIAGILGISPVTVRRFYGMARVTMARLLREVHGIEIEIPE